MAERALPWLVCAWLLMMCGEAGAPDWRNTRNVVLVSFDGVRIEEMFGGMDAVVLEHALALRGRRMEDSVAYRKFWAPTREERRQRLMPFFWGTLMTRYGSIAGDRERGSRVQLANAHRLSYPGYSELLTGQARDDVVHDNEPRSNPYPTVLEFLRRELRLKREEAAVFASWETIGLIAENEPGTLFVNAGPAAYEHRDPVVRRLSELQFDTPTPWERVRPDAYTFEFALAHLHTHRPRILFIALDETDDLAHDGRYEDYLEALHRYDRWLERLWQELEADSSYRGRTSLLVTVDHGRGREPAQWSDHGEAVEGAGDVWLAVVSPDCPRRGAWAGGTIAYEQLASTLVRLMGLDDAKRAQFAWRRTWERVCEGPV